MRLALVHLGLMLSPCVLLVNCNVLCRNSSNDGFIELQLNETCSIVLQRI